MCGRFNTDTSKTARIPRFNIARDHDDLYRADFKHSGCTHVGLRVPRPMGTVTGNCPSVSARTSAGNRERFADASNRWHIGLAAELTE